MPVTYMRKRTGAVAPGLVAQDAPERESALPGAVAKDDQPLLDV
jgi:hypothetical protein